MIGFPNLSVKVRVICASAPSFRSNAQPHLQAASERPSDEIMQQLLNSDVLSPASRAVLVLHFEEEMTLADVSAVLEIPLGTVKSRLAFGLTALRKHFADRRL